MLLLGGRELHDTAKWGRGRARPPRSFLRDYYRSVGGQHVYPRRGTVTGAKQSGRKQNRRLEQS